MSSHPREPPPRVLTEPDVNVSAHPALPIEACPHSKDQCANSLDSTFKCNTPSPYEVLPWNRPEPIPT